MSYDRMPFRNKAAAKADRNGGGDDGKGSSKPGPGAKSYKEAQTAKSEALQRASKQGAGAKGMKGVKDARRQAYLEAKKARRADPVQYRKDLGKQLED